jgi:Spy/CpxP family protein refolding chaperone
MFGFLIGTACLIGLIKVLRGGWRRGYGHGGWSGGSCGGGGGGCGGGWGSRGRGGHDHEGGWGSRHGADWDRGGPFWLRGLFERLGTSAAQEKVIRDAIDEARRSASELRDEGRHTRSDVARAVRSASFDETVMGELFARHDTHLEKLRKDTVGVIGKVHAVLDDRQRDILAQIIERGPFAGGFRGGPFRGAWA